MPDNKLADAEIVKALDYWKKFDKEIDEMLLARYKGDKDLLEQKEIVKITFEVFDLIKYLQAENERLEKNIETETNHITRLENQIERLLQRIKTAKSEAYKECVEKAKNEIDTQPHSRSLEASRERFRIHIILNNLLKELVGE